MNETKKTYVVAKGASFVGDKKVYKEGDEIDETAFKDKERFQKFLTCKPPKIIEAPAESTEKKDDNGGDEINAEARKARKALEDLALKDGFKKLEEIKNLKDEELEELLKKAGKLK